MTAIEHKAIARHEITGVILAGGRGSRLGGVDKGLVHLHGRPLIEHAIDALRPQVDGLLISANRNHDIYAAYGFPVIADAMGDYAGPLAGMLSTMRAAATRYIVTVPCDTPAFPATLAERLGQAMGAVGARAGVVSCDGRMQPVFALLHTGLADALQEYLVQGGHEVGEWMRRQGAASVDFASAAGAFRNINTKEQLRDLESAEAKRAG